MEMTPSEASEEPQVLFKRGKKRKMYRPRGEGENEGAGAAASIAAASTTTDAMIEYQRGKKAAAKPADGIGDEAVKSGQSKDAVESLGHGRRMGEDDDSTGEEEGVSVSEVLRLRNARRKLRGIELRAAEGGPREEDTDQAASADVGDHEDSAENLRAIAAISTEAIVGGVTKRFAPQVGLVGEIVNRHMEEYIESALAKRQPAQSADAAAAAATATAFANFTAASRRRTRQSELDPSQSQELPQELNEHDDDRGPLGGNIAPGTDGKVLRGEGAQGPALRGKLHEVDLGTESRALNIARTERVRRILRGEDPLREDGSGDGKASSSRVRRNSEDALRDRMVEEFLNDNTLDVYATEDADAIAGDQSLPADERVAEQFRREFLLAMSQSRRRRRAQRPVNAHFAKGQKRPGAKKETEILRGPKLGGSRNERAAMRDILLKQANEERAAAARR